jgi:hypothetical protein
LVQADGGKAQHVQARRVPRITSSAAAPQPLTAHYVGLRAARGGYGIEQPFHVYEGVRGRLLPHDRKAGRDAIRALEVFGSITRTGTVPIDEYRAILWELGRSH